MAKIKRQDENENIQIFMRFSGLIFNRNHLTNINRSFTSYKC